MTHALDFGSNVISHRVYQKETDILRRDVIVCFDRNQQLDSGNKHWRWTLFDSKTAIHGSVLGFTILETQLHARVLLCSRALIGNRYDGIIACNYFNLLDIFQRKLAAATATRRQSYARVTSTTRLVETPAFVQCFWHTGPCIDETRKYRAAKHHELNIDRKTRAKIIFNSDTRSENWLTKLPLPSARRLPGATLDHYAEHRPTDTTDISSISDSEAANMFHVLGDCQKA